jgi:putative membrane protein
MALRKQKLVDVEKEMDTRLILRDHLAVDRTRLAVERAFLAYIRTGLSFLVAGVSGYNLFRSVWIRSFGLMFLCLGIVIVFWGGYRGHRLNKNLQRFGSTHYKGYLE